MEKKLCKKNDTNKFMAVENKNRKLNLQHNSENSGLIYLSVIKLHCVFRKKFGKSHGKNDI